MIPKLESWRDSNGQGQKKMGYAKLTIISVNPQIMGKVEGGNSSNEFNKTNVGEMFPAIGRKLTSPVEDHLDTEIAW